MVAEFEQDGNRGIPGFADSRETDAVRGIDVEWFIEGHHHCERDLEPFEYRVLCVLLLIPLAVFSPRKERRSQLLRHWDAFKEVSGCCSNTDAQHLLLGILIRVAQRPGLIASLALAGLDFSKPGARLEAEKAFCTALKTAMNGEQPSSIIIEVQDRINAIVGNRHVFVFGSRFCFC